MLVDTKVGDSGNMGGEAQTIGYKIVYRNVLYNTGNIANMF